MMMMMRFPTQALFKGFKKFKLGVEYCQNEPYPKGNCKDSIMLSKQQTASKWLR